MAGFKVITEDRLNLTRFILRYLYGLRHNPNDLCTVSDITRSLSGIMSFAHTRSLPVPQHTVDRQRGVITEQPGSPWRKSWDWQRTGYLTTRSDEGSARSEEHTSELQSLRHL